MPLSDQTREKLRTVSTATISTALFKRGLRNQMLQGVRPLDPGKPTMVGEAFTLRYIPAREDLNLITVFQDRSYTFITKTPPASVLLKRAAGIAKGSSEPNKDKVAQIDIRQVEEIARTKMPDLNAGDIEAAKLIILGTARSMGIEIGATSGAIEIEEPEDEVEEVASGA